MVSLTESSFSNLIDRCPLARSIFYLPGPDDVADYDIEVISDITTHSNISEVEFIDSESLLSEICSRNLGITLCNVCIFESEFSIALTSSKLIKPPSFNSTSVLYMEDVDIDLKMLTYFHKSLEISFIRCSFSIESDITDLAFPHLQKFLYIEKSSSSASSRIGSQLLVKATNSKHLKVLQLGIRDFSALEMVSLSMEATRLEVLEVLSTGSYSASLQQLKYASIIADICIQCRVTLQRISLPSSILIKRFFTQLISCGHLFLELRKLEMTGIADTKMFLAPGNMVETLFYQEFLKLCLAISSLSLHSYTGSLVSLMLPLTLTELILPWDNRLNLERQKSEILSCLSLLPHLCSLSIFGVEEVDSLLQDGHDHQQSPSLVIRIESLQIFHLKNVRLQVLDLTECTNLNSFCIHCCPSMRSLNLPVKSLKRVYIYDDYLSYIDKFLEDLVRTRSLHSEASFCHVHIQLHKVLNKVSGLFLCSKYVPSERRADKLYAFIEKKCTEFTDKVDFLILKDDKCHVLEHNSGEPMYPITEYQSQNFMVNCRMGVFTMQKEIMHKERILEGLKRWRNCIMDVKSSAQSSLPHNYVVHSSPPISFQTIYCNGSFTCGTNLKYLIDLNTVAYLTQPSGRKSKDTCKDESYNGDSSHGGSGEDTTRRGISELNVPRIQPHVKEYLRYSDFGTNFREWNVNSNPLILVSIIEYTHAIHTLFYYD